MKKISKCILLCIVVVFVCLLTGSESTINFKAYCFNVQGLDPRRDGNCVITNMEELKAFDFGLSKKYDEKFFENKILIMADYTVANADTDLDVESLYYNEKSELVINVNAVSETWAFTILPGFWEVIIEMQRKDYNGGEVCRGFKYTCLSGEYPH